MDRQAEQAAFAKACAYLNYNKAAKWTALASAAGTGVVYVALLLVLWLFTDLLVYRGRLPTYHSLTPLQQTRFHREWNGLNLEERQQRLQAIGVKDRIQQIAEVKPDEANAPRDDVRMIWCAQVRHIIAERIGVDALAASEGLDQVDYNADVGITSLMVRSATDGRITTPVLAALARGVPWMRNARGGGLISPYLIGLLLTGIGLGILGAALALLMREMAARATIEAATRCTAPSIITPSVWARWLSGRWDRLRQ